MGSAKNRAVGCCIHASIVIHPLYATRVALEEGGDRGANHEDAEVAIPLHGVRHQAPENASTLAAPA